MARLCFDYGHGGQDGGACYKGRKESNDVLSLGKAVAVEVRRHGITVNETRTGDSTVGLGERSKFENKNAYNYFISFHRNAFEAEKAKGVETYTYLNAGVKAKELAKRVQCGLVALGFVDRGVKSANFHVLRETKAPAVLIELGFIDNTGDNSLFHQKKNEIIKALAKSILEVLGVIYVETLIPKQAQNGQTIYRVMQGSYTVKENAENQVLKLREMGIDATIIVIDK
ncbi:N-acetylmuramoyl-L-alanine amidase [Clostridium lacusfryxellense]|uniref:N-acetylmuramoyl-L-alanine amidase n=1 Tax=Clostridium lacusfryxellense TaxID=205328 RepID=UPI001C0C927E|nr:N-acetylmuramoyl-L-alanine amidase [Clostridium lacusfryxellense]MBU3113043.1 N-acetylmuramoyl-L-alanine amidase [Clostridium lacusfryxellense]